MSASTEETDNDSTIERKPFESQLPAGWQRFLAHVIEHGFGIGQRAPEDFIRHFPPGAIMSGLESEAKLRANILVLCTGTRPKIALKKSAASCGEDLQIALDEGETDAETIVTLFDPDDRVRFMDQQALWAYVTEGEFWNCDAKKDVKKDVKRDDTEHDKAAAHVAYILTRALIDGLIDHREIVDGITTQKITELLPRAALHDIIAGALDASRHGKAFSERDLLAMCPPVTLAKHVPLPILWERVIAPKIVSRHKFVPGPVPKPQPIRTATLESDDAVDLDLDIDSALGGLHEEDRARHEATPS